MNRLCLHSTLRQDPRVDLTAVHTGGVDSVKLTDAIARIHLAFVIVIEALDTRLLAVTVETAGRFRVLSFWASRSTTTTTTSWFCVADVQLCSLLHALVRYEVFVVVSADNGAAAAWASRRAGSIMGTMDDVDNVDWPEAESTSASSSSRAVWISESTLSRQGMVM